jgi:hypothetical protein
VQQKRTVHNGNFSDGALTPGESIRQSLGTKQEFLSYSLEALPGGLPACLHAFKLVSQNEFKPTIRQRLGE